MAAAIFSNLENQVVQVIHDVNITEMSSEENFSQFDEGIKCSIDLNN